jgi:hypothetical protein
MLGFRVKDLAILGFRFIYVLSCMYLKDWLTIEKLRVKFGISLE